MHRDSPQSPLLPHLTPYERFKRSIRRTNHRFKRIPKADVFLTTSGEYLIKLSIGTPPFPIFGVADTGSGLIWTQCQPCKKCYKQNRPLFAPKKSSTYKKVLYNSKQCLNFGRNPSRDNKTCAYSIVYLDGSQSHGILSTDKLTLFTTNTKSQTLSSSIVFGCGFNNSGLFGEESSGIIGLGPSPGSLISQMSNQIGGKFSYCLVSTYDSSEMHFGGKAIVSGAGVISTRLQILDGISYSIKLKGLSVGNERFNFGKRNSSVGMNMALDSGSLLTYLPRKLCSFVEANMRKEINQNPVSDPDKLFRLCYNVSDEINIPPVTVHLEGANLKLKDANTFIQFEDIMCLAFSSHYNVPIFGVVAQQNFLIGYDLGKKIVSFKPTNCARN